MMERDVLNNTRNNCFSSCVCPDLNLGGRLCLTKNTNHWYNCGMGIFTAKAKIKNAEKMKIKAKKNRVWEIDFLRGICILLMVFDHCMFDFYALPVWTIAFWRIKTGPIYQIAEFADFYWEHPVRIAVRLAVVFTFVLLSGISCVLSRSDKNRLIKLTAASLLLSFGTILADEFFSLGVSIYFGILHIMALSLFIYILLKKIWDNKYFFLFIGVLIIIGGIIIDFVNVPRTQYYTLQYLWESIIGLCYLGADSYGILPYTGIFLVGVFFGRLIYGNKISRIPSLNFPVLRPINFIGRHTVWVYLLHQPVILGLVVLAAHLAGYKF